MKRTEKDRLLKNWLNDKSLSLENALRHLLFDEVTELPSLPLLIPKVQAMLESHENLGIMYINIVRFSRIEEIYGYEAFDQIMCLIGDHLKNMKGKELRSDDSLAYLSISGNAFVIVLSPPRDEKVLRIKDLEAVKTKIERSINHRLKKELDASLFQKFGCYIGFSLIRKRPNVRLERLVYGALEDALRFAHFVEERDDIRKLNELVEIIHHGEITTVFQPVVDLKSNQIIGYEAFTRGPIGEFELPDNLFNTAYEADMVWQLESLCRKKTFENAKLIPPENLLFVNMESYAVHDPSLLELTDSSSLPVEHANIVFEITERCAVSDYQVFRGTLDHFRKHGFKVAIDDIGVGYGSLHSIAEVKPDYIKVDISLVRNVENDPIRQELIATLAKFSKNVEVRLIAEGIETEKELECLKSLGVDFGQGYFFAYPMPVFQGIN